MAYLKHIVTHINETLAASLFESDRFANRRVIGLAQLLPRKDRDGAIQLVPSYVDNRGEGCYVGPDDDFDLIIYHRVVSIAVSKASLPSYGDARKMDNNVARVSLVAFGRRDRLCMTNDELAILLQASMPEAISRQMLAELQFRTGNITINDIILNDLQVFQEEFQGIEYFLKPDQFLLKVNYTIESAFLKECFTNCPPCTS